MALRTFGKISLQKGHWAITALEPHAIIKLKALFDKIPKVQTPPYFFTNCGESCEDLEWFLIRYPLEISDEDLDVLKTGAKKHRLEREEMESFLRPDYTPVQRNLKLPLRHYQSQAVDLWLKKKKLLVGDVVGLGKTAVAIGGMTDASALPMLVVVQTHLQIQWKEQIEKFLDVKVHLIKGTKPYQLPSADVYIIKYSCLAGWSDIFSTGFYKSVVFDEVQDLRIPSSQKYQAGEIAVKYATHVLGLSATPIYNHGNEIFSVLDLISPFCLGPSSAFLREWTSNDKVVKDPKALGSYLREKHLFLRRTREDVGMELPPVNKIVHAVDFDEQAVKDVEETAKKLAIKVMQGSFVERGQAARELDIMVRMATGISKAKYVAAYVKMLLDNGESVLLSGWHRSVYDIWLKELESYKPVMYTGSESPKEKEESKNKFISGESPLMIISLRSGVGLDGLQKKGSIVVIGELDWSPSIHEQLIGRLARDGQEQQVTAIFLVSDSGSDPLIVNLLGLKSSQAKGIVDPFIGAEMQYSDESRINKLAQSLLEKKGLWLAKSVESVE